MLRVTDGRTIYKPHSNAGPVYGASGSAVDRGLSTYPRILSEIGEPPSGSKLVVIGPDDGSPPDGRTPTKVLIGDQKSTFGSRADVPSSTYPQSLNSIGCSNLRSISGPPNGSPDSGQTPPRKYIVDNGRNFRNFGSAVDATSTTNPENFKRIGGNNFFLRLGGFRKPPDPENRKFVVFVIENRFFLRDTTRNKHPRQFSAIYCVFPDIWLVVVCVHHQGNYFLLRLEPSELENEKFLVVFFEIRLFFKRARENKLSTRHTNVFCVLWEHGLIVVFVGGCCFAPNMILFLIGSGIDDMPLYRVNKLEKPKQPLRRSSLTLVDHFFFLSIIDHGPHSSLLIVVFARGGEIAIAATHVPEKSSHDDDNRFISFI